MRVLHAPTLGWRDVDLRDPLAAATGLPVQIENSGRACALAQWWALRADGVPIQGDLVFVSVSDGVGVGVVMNGEVLRGRHNIAGEFGHVPLSLDGPRCSCGANGCWEAYVSNLATLARYFGRAVGDGPQDAAERAVHRRGSLARARGGDAKAIAALHATARYLGLGLASVINALNPACVVIGGEITEAWDLIEGIVRSALAERALTPAAPPPRSAPSPHPNIRACKAPRPSSSRRRSPRRWWPDTHGPRRTCRRIARRGVRATSAVASIPPVHRQGRHHEDIPLQHPSWLVLAAAAFALMLAASPAAAQDYRARVQGTVSDTSQAVLPGATVTLTNDATGVAVDRGQRRQRPLPLRLRRPGRLHGDRRARWLQDGGARRRPRAATRRPDRRPPLDSALTERPSRWRRRGDGAVQHRAPAADRGAAAARSDADPRPQPVQHRRARSDGPRLAGDQREPAVPPRLRQRLRRRRRHAPRQRRAARRRAARRELQDVLHAGRRRGRGDHHLEEQRRRRERQQPRRHHQPEHEVGHQPVPRLGLRQLPRSRR